MNKKRVLVAMSGGVDSSVAALLLCRQGYEATGTTCKLFGNDDLEGSACGIDGRDPDSGIVGESTCCSSRDIEDARQVAFSLGMDYFVFNYQGLFGREVIDRFCKEYLCGRTPNPCIDCNRFMKFDLLLHRARELGCDYIATGHYVQVGRDEAGRCTLSKAADPAKDQSYVLYALTQDQLAHTMFPLGGLTKPEVRVIAQEQGFRNAHKAESQDICFVPDGDYLAFLERRRGCPYEAGAILTPDGTRVGTHKGAAGYTIGQRKGLGVALREPMYVVTKDMAANTVTLGPQEMLMAPSCTVADWNWVWPQRTPQDEPLVCAVKTHYRQREQPARLTALPDGRVRVDFDEPQRAMTPGQAAVAYVGDQVVGGGTIESAGE